MNEKQAKQLKNGDKILIEVTFDQIDDDGDVVFEYANSVSDYERGFISPKNIVVGVSETQPNKPKYDPCRLFKKGDKVRIVTCNGRPPYDLLNEDEYVPDETIFSVMSDECICGYVDLYEKAPEDGFQIHHSNIELVAPVDELSPYSVHESEVLQGFDIVRDKLCVMAFPFGAKECGWYYNRLEAKEAAEAECSRLNAAYRKAQK